MYISPLMSFTPESHIFLSYPICISKTTHLDVLLVELGVVLTKGLWLHPGALLGVQIKVVVVSSLHPVFHPLTAIITWSGGRTEYS